jgi:hypothetical protein
VAALHRDMARAGGVMSWFAVDDRFWSHRKVMSMRRSPHYADAIALWTLAGS